MRGLLTVGIFFVIAAPATAADVGQLKGGWVERSVSCKALQNQSDERILSITNKQVEFYEASCLIRGVKKSGASYSLKLLCEGEGQTDQMTWHARLDAKDKLVVKDGFTYKRCR